MISEPHPGDLLDERFAILELIGRGGMGSVFKAMDLSTGRSVAVKFPSFELESDPAFYSRFQRELQIGHPRDHLRCCGTVVDEVSQHPYLVEAVGAGRGIDRLARIDIAVNVRQD